jgi:hypothetical protein
MEARMKTPTIGIISTGFVIALLSTAAGAHSGAHYGGLLDLVVHFLVQHLPIIIPVVLLLLGAKLVMGRRGTR